MSLEQLEQSLDGLQPLIAELKRAGEGSAAKDCLTELGRLRLLIHRMNTNRSTSFLGPAYAMLEIFLVVSCMLFTSFTYLLLLIRDLDNPFQYDGSSCVDADLTPLGAARERLGVTAP